MKSTQNNEINIDYIDIIPGIRVLAIFLIAWFHIWQQSWLSPYLPIGEKTLDFMFLPRAGYLWVDMFIMLSAFQLFLPYVKKIMNGEQFPTAGQFYKKRALRIMPSYYFCILICLVMSLALNEYQQEPLLLDLFTHLTFTHNFFKFTYLWTNLNVVLWTVAILMQFYLIFPLLVRAYKKYPVVSFAVMVSIAFAFRHYLVNSSKSPSMFVNQLPAFLDVIALGFFAAYLVVIINKKINYQKYSTGFTLISIMSFFWIAYYMKELSGVLNQELIQRWQGEYRFPVAIAFMTLIISTAYSRYGYRRIFSNRVMIFLSSVSYNYYIWHQYIAVRMVEFKFPYYISDLPQVMAEKPWQYTYTAASFIIPLIVAIIVTWGIDKQMIPAIQKIISMRNEKKLKTTGADIGNIS